MKKLIISIIILLFLIDVQAQTRRMDNVAVARTYTSQNQNETVQPLLLEANRQFRMADFEEALITLDNAVAQNPNSAEALAERARFKKIIGMETEAEMDLRKAEQINPYAANLYGYYGNLGLLEILAVEPALAIRKLTDYQKLNYYYRAFDQKMLVTKESGVRWDDLENVLLDIENNKLADAQNRIDLFLKKYPKTSKGYDLKGLVLKKEGKTEEAIAAFNRAVELDPNAAISWYNLGQMERLLGNYNESEKHLNKAIELNNNLTKAYFEKAMLMKQVGRQEEAIATYNTILDLEGNTYMEALVNRGLTKKMMGDFSGARTDLDKAIEEFPDNGDLRRNRGNLNLLLGIHRKAIDDYTEAIQLNAEDAESYYNRAIAFFIIYDKISACADLEKSLELGYVRAAEMKKFFCTW